MSGQEIKINSGISSNILTSFGQNSNKNKNQGSDEFIEKSIKDKYSPWLLSRKKFGNDRRKIEKGVDVLKSLFGIDEDMTESKFNSLHGEDLVKSFTNIDIEKSLRYSDGVFVKSGKELKSKLGEQNKKYNEQISELRRKNSEMKTKIGVEPDAERRYYEQDENGDEIKETQYKLTDDDYSAMRTKYETSDVAVNSPIYESAKSATDVANMKSDFNENCWEIMRKRCAIANNNVIIRNLTDKQKVKLSMSELKEYGF